MTVDRQKAVATGGVLLLPENQPKKLTRTLVLAERSPRYSEPGTPFKFSYDADLLAEHGFALTGVSKTQNRLAAKVRDVIEHRSNVLWEPAVRGMSKRADLVLALLEQYAVGPSILASLRIPPYRNAPLAVLVCWLAEVARTATRDERRVLAERFKRADLVFQLSSNQTELLVDLGLDSDRIATVPFGVNAGYFSPAAHIPRDIQILAVGQDRGRDYKTLFEAVRGTPLKVDLVCKSTNVEGLDKPDNVRLHGPVNFATYRNLLCRAQVVVVPTHDLAYPTGQTVAMEAAACEACVVVTGTAPMREYFQHEHDALLVASGDVESLRIALTRAANDVQLRHKLGSAARQRIVAQFTTQHLWAAVARELSAHGLVQR